MARAESPLDTGDGRLLRFAADLRRLREEAGGPAYRELSRRAHYSASALADAASGRRLPSLSLTLAYVSACNGDTETWERRWHALAAELTTPPDEQRDGHDARGAPYAGLAMFQVEDAERFYGRDRLLAELSNRVTRLRFVAAVGSSGSGKSSLLRAGLVHRARAGDLCGASGLAMVLTPGPHPLDELAVRLAALAGGTPSAMHAALRTDPRSLHLSVLRAVVDLPANSEVLVVVDQFEEVFTLCQDDDERRQFLRVLDTAARAPNSRARIVIGLRADFYAHCTHDPELVEALGEAQVLVGPMSPEELRSVITQPAVSAGYRVETALVSQVIAEAVGQPGVLPLVSHALLETWRRRRGNTLTLAGYEAAGGITRSIARTAEAIYTDLAQDQQLWARELFLRLVALGEGTEDTKRRVDRAELDMGSPDREEVLERLARARLVTLDRETVELTHEALVRCWPRLHAWLTDSRDGLRIHRQLTDAANTWQELDRDPGALYRGHRLTQANQWVSASGDRALSARERDFLQASLAEQARSQASARRRTRRLRQLLALLTVLLVVATVATGYALQAERTATEQRNLAIAQKVLSQARALRVSNPTLSLQLSVAAYRLSNSPEARSALLNSFNIPYATLLDQHADGVATVAFSSDGRILATASIDKTLRLWDIATPHRPRELATITEPVEMIQAALRPDGRMVATLSIDRTVRLWDISDPTRPRQLTSLTGEAMPYLPASVTFNPDGRTLVIAGGTEDHRGIVLLWDVANPGAPRRQATLTGQFGPSYAALFVPDGRTLATVSGATRTLPINRSEVRLWDVSDPTAPREQAALPEFAGGTEPGGRVVAAFHPDGHTLATAQGDDTVTLWDVTDLRHPRSRVVLNGFAGTVTALVFSPDGHTLATGTSDRTIQLWSATGAQRPRVLATLTGAKATVYLLAFSPDGRILASATSQTVVRLDDVAAYAYPTRANGAVHAVDFSPDGRTLATGNADGTIGLWDTTDPYHTRQLAILRSDTRRGPVNVVAFSPGGQFLATIDTDGAPKLWDINRPRAPVSTIGNTASPMSSFVMVAFSPDGRTLATGSGDGTVVLWDIVDVARPQRSGTFAGASGTSRTIAFSPDGRILATGGIGSTARMWDVADPHTPRELTTVATQDAGITRSVALSTDGRSLAIGTSDRTIRLWDISDPRVPRMLATIALSSTVSEIVFGLNGHTLAAGLFDGSVELWDVTDRHHPQGPITLAGPASGSDRATSIAFSPTNQLLATAGAYIAASDRSARLWDTNIERVSDRICELAWPTITPTDWNHYFPGIAYQPPCP